MSHSEPVCKRSKMSSSLDQLKSATIVVADTGDFEGNSFFINNNNNICSRTSLFN